MRWGATVPRERFGGRVYRPNMKHKPQKQASGASVAPPLCKTAQKCRFCFDSNNRILALMARSNSPTLGHPKFPQAGPPDYDDSGATAMRAAASLRR